MRSRSVRRIIPLIFVSLVVVASVIYLFSVSGNKEGPLQASGSVEAVEVLVAPEIGGKVMQVLAEAGAPVELGEPLFILDDSLLQAQRQRALAAVETAQAALAVAQAAAKAADVNLQLAQWTGRMEERAIQDLAWRSAVPNVDALPSWYFEQSESLAAAVAALEAAQQTLQAKKSELDDLLGDPLTAEVAGAEARLAQAQEAFLVAQQVLQRALSAAERPEVLEAARDQVDATADELEAARSAYDELLSDETAEDLLQARAELAVARAGLEAAQARFDSLQTGDLSFRVQAAQAAYAQAQAAVTQAQAGVSQAQRELELVELQLEKLTVRAPVAGTILTRDIEPGSVVQPGSVAFSIGLLDDLRITVYIAENRYGDVELGGLAEVRVDSYPGDTFEGRVVHMASRAEFTPRNVETEEGRRTMVFAVEIAVTDPQGRLKPGMPADVTFILP